MGLPASLRPIQKYLFHAKQLETVYPLVSHYCYLYALRTSLPLVGPNDQDAFIFVKELRRRCEEKVPEFASTETIHREEVGAFAERVFQDANHIYRSLRANLETAKSFFAAVCFFDVCTHFGELTDEQSMMRQQARVYAALIRRAIQQGEEPIPRDIREGKAQPEVMDNPESEPSKEEAGPPGALVRPGSRIIPPAPTVEEYGSARPSSTPQNEPTPTPTLEPLPERAPEYPSSTEPSPLPTTGDLVSDDPEAAEAAISEATRRAQFAISALNFRDVPTAIKELNASLSALGGK